MKQIEVSEYLNKVVRLPIVRIDRSEFLKKELIKYCDSQTIELAIDNNPAYAGIDKSIIDSIAKNSIKYETRRVSVLSFGLGIPSSIPGLTATMAATIPADISQYFIATLRITQKLAYLYGFQEFEIKENSIDDETMNELIIFMGAMYGVQQANTALKAIAENAAAQFAKDLSKKALTKTFYYPIVKSISQKLGYSMTREIFSKSVSKGIAVVGGVISGGLSYATFKPCCYRLKNILSEYSLCDPEYYSDSSSNGSGLPL